MINLGALKKKVRCKVSNIELAKPAALSVCYSGREKKPLLESPLSSENISPLTSVIRMCTRTGSKL